MEDGTPFSSLVSTMMASQPPLEDPTVLLADPVKSCSLLCHQRGNRRIHEVWDEEKGMLAGHRYLLRRGREEGKKHLEAAAFRSGPCAHE